MAGEVVVVCVSVLALVVVVFGDLTMLCGCYRIGSLWVCEKGAKVILCE